MTKKSGKTSEHGERPISRGRHSAECKICSHADREEIERAFVEWNSLSRIATQFSVSRDSVYRHAHTFQLMEKRRRNVRAAQGRWPSSYDVLWELLIARQGRQNGTRTMVAVLRLGRQFGFAKLGRAVEQALGLGCTDLAAIHHLLMSDQLQHGVAETVEIGPLAAYERPLPTLTEYNQLLDRERATVEVPA